MEIILSLISGIIGALIGGFLTYIGAINASKKQIDSLYALEKENRTYAEKQQVQAMTSALTMEIEENIILATKFSVDSDLSQTIAVNTTSLLSTEAWITYRGTMLSLPSSLQIKLLNAYAMIRQFNALVEDNRGRYASGNSVNVSAVRVYAKSVLKTCQEAKEEMTKV